MDITADPVAVPTPRIAAPLGAASTRTVSLAWTACRGAAAQARWEQLATCASEPNPFFEPWYLLPSLTALDPAGRIELLVVEAGGEWLGLLPLARRANYYRYPVPHLHGWLHANAFLGMPLVARGREAEVWQALLEHADREARAGLFLHLPGLPLGGPLHAALVQVCATGRRPLALVHREERALLASQLGADAYFEAALSGKKRKELRRQFARLSEEGAITIERQRDASAIDAWTAAFLTLEQAGWKGAAGSALACAPETAQLFGEALAQAAARGRLERLSLSLDGQPIAMLATLLAGDGAFSYKTAFDERYARFSPGVLLQRENLALLDDPQLAWCDSCAAADHPMIDHLWRERRAIGRVSIGIGGSLRRAAFRLFVSAELSRSAPAGGGSGAPL